ncbi:hypothetical protein OFN09_30200, partial [Escherichia coli]|nr:hypothetical protein [Escherichia coli]
TASEPLYRHVDGVYAIDVIVHNGGTMEAPAVVIDGRPLSPVNTRTPTGTYLDVMSAEERGEWAARADRYRQAELDGQNVLDPPASFPPEAA